MTLLLLLTSSGGPKPIDVAIPAQADLTATATGNAPVTPAAEINAFAGATATLRIATDRAAEVIYVTSDLVATLRIATDRAAEVIYVTSDLAATLRLSTVRRDATIPATSGVQADPEARPAVSPQAVASAVASVSAILDSRTRRAQALIPGLAEVYIRIPPRSLGGVASSGPGRTGAGSLTGGGRGTAGTATSASGR